MVQTLFDALLPRGKSERAAEENLTALLAENGFDATQHEQIRTDLREGRIGLAQNRLPASATIEDVHPGDVQDATHLKSQISNLKSQGEAALAAGSRRRHHPRRRSRLPLDPRRGRLQSPPPLRQTRRTPPHLPRNPPR